MALTPLNKHTYVFAAEPVSSANINEVQDAVIELQNNWTDPEEIGDVAELDTTATEIVGAVNEVNGKFGLINENFSDEFSNTKTYKLGQFYIHDNTLYRCTTAITTAENWTAAHWTETTIGAEIENKALWFTAVPVSVTSGTIIEFSDSRITTDHVLAAYVFYNEVSITELINWSTNLAGKITIAGTCTAATTVDLFLVKKNN